MKESGKDASEMGMVLISLEMEISTLANTHLACLKVMDSTSGLMVINIAVTSKEGSSRVKVNGDKSQLIPIILLVLTNSKATMKQMRRMGMVNSPGKWAINTVVTLKMMFVMAGVL